ncbi:MAG: DsbA family protein [Deltaproteobacteria bacterium]|nr:DsbA family protein [Deltaproteobacteria bacterium]
MALLYPGLALAQSASVEEILADLAKSRAARGIPESPLSLIEFSDFQCSFCRKFWNDTLPLIDAKYIQPGRVKFVYRHFAILGKASTAAAEASECASEQERFWPYHDKLFSNHGALAFTQAKLKEYARELKLKEKVFDQCLESRKYLKKIESDTAVGAMLGVRGTPAFFLNNQLIVGAQPFGVFDTAIRDALAKARRPAKKQP